MVNFGPLAAEIVSLVWGTPANFNGFVILLLTFSFFAEPEIKCGVAIWPSGHAFEHEA